MPGRIEKKFIDELTKEFSGINGVRIISRKSDFPDSLKEGPFSYEPDVVITVKGKITHFVEVETKPVNKALVGGACTCAYFVREKLNDKPKLYFAVGDTGKRYLANYKLRKKIFDEFFKMDFSEIRIASQQQIKERLRKDLPLVGPLT